MSVVPPSRQCHRLGRGWACTLSAGHGGRCAAYRKPTLLQRLALRVLRRGGSRPTEFDLR